MSKITRIVWFVALFLTPQITVSHAVELNLTISVSPAGDAKQVDLVKGASTIPLMTHFSDSPEEIKVTADNYARQPMSIVITWNDSSDFSVPMFLLSAFAGEKLTMRLTKPAAADSDPKSVAVKSCNPSVRPHTAEAALSTMAICSWAANHLKDPEGNNPKIFYQAVNGWFVANYWLYTQSQPNLNFSPYGLQPELVAELRDVVDRIVSKKRPRSNFNPISYDSIVQALYEYDQEPIRMLSLLGKLKREGRYQDGIDIINGASKAYTDLTGGVGSKVVVGVNAAIIENNRAYFQTLQSSTF